MSTVGQEWNWELLKNECRLLDQHRNIR